MVFVDAQKMGVMVDPTNRELTADEITRIAQTYRVWSGEKDAGKYEDVPGFCKSATLDEISQHGFVLTPGRYVGFLRPNPTTFLQLTPEKDERHCKTKAVGVIPSIRFLSEHIV